MPRLVCLNINVETGGMTIGTTIHKKVINKQSGWCLFSFASIARAMAVRKCCAIIEPALERFGRRDNANGTTLGAEAAAAIRQMPD